LNTEKSRALYTRATERMPGGVNSPVRAFRAVGGAPRFMRAGEGAELIDVDANRYLDCVGSWGPLILGHAHPRVVEAVSLQLCLGATFGAPTELEVELAEEICGAVGSIAKLRLVSSGTEATMSAVRVARGFTGRTRILKFEGAYHGHADFLLAKAGSGVATLGLPECAGVPAAVVADTITLPFNDLDAVCRLFRERGDEIACVITEPVVGNMGCVPPRPGFLELLRELTARHGALLIFDEVMTGFRLAYGGAQERFGIVPDMTTLGKIVGGGLPLAAYGGGTDVMDCVAPVGPVYQAGTLSGNPLAVAAGLATLRLLRDERDRFYPYLESIGARVAEGLREAARNAGVPVRVNQAGSMVTAFFNDGTEVADYASACGSDRRRFAAWFHAMLDSGIYWPPSQFESAFLSAAMTEADVERLIDAAGRAFGAEGVGV
jgi:glutamate-1-semialdehyde 2,1-aminomutase